MVRYKEQPVVSFDLTDRGLNLGDGVFDTSLARNGRIFRRKSHIDRMADASEILGIPFDEMAAGTALDALAEAIGDGAVRLTLTRGPRATRVVIPKKSSAASLRRRRSDAHAAVPGFETWHDIDPPERNVARLAHQGAALSRFRACAGAGFRARCATRFCSRNTHSRVACLATANIFAIFGRQLVTPPLSDGALAGTTRAFVLSKAHGLHFDVAERSLPLEKFSRARRSVRDQQPAADRPVQPARCHHVSLRGERDRDGIANLDQRGDCGRMRTLLNRAFRARLCKSARRGR